MIGIDTNVLVRYLVADDSAQARKSEKFIRQECSADNPGYINRIVLCELVWVLTDDYRYQRNQIGDVLEMLLRTEELSVESLNAAWAALRLYRQGNCDFADAFLGRTNIDAGCRATATFDRKAARLDIFEGL